MASQRRTHSSQAISVKLDISLTAAEGSFFFPPVSLSNTSPTPPLRKTVESHRKKKLSGGIRMRSLQKELVCVKKNVRVYTKQ